MLHINWMILGLIGMVYLLVGPLTHAVSIVLMDVCDVLDPLLTDKSKWESTIGRELGDELNNMIVPCLFGDGDVTSSLPIKDSFASLSSYQKDLGDTSALGKIKESPTLDAID
jgi:hypothetical protein